jgi:FkbM family methyltransferase
MVPLSDWRINFFDLGAYTGEETALFLRQMEGMKDGRHRPVVCAYLFEPQPIYVRYLEDRFRDDPRVFVERAAIGSEIGRTYLYVGKSPECHSIYPDKHDVGKGASIGVREIMFSSWLRDLELDARPEQTINILKANIEGAEWDLIQDLEKNYLWGLFDVYLGSEQWTGDMRKCHSLLPHIAEARRILDSHDITVKPYSCGTDNYQMTIPCTDLAVEVRQIMEARTLVVA